MAHWIDDPDGAFVALVNGEGQYSLWPDRLDVPPGWRVGHPASSRRECLEYIDDHWKDIRTTDPVGDAVVSPDRRTPATPATARAHRCVHDLFADQAARTPDAPALVWRDQRLTYRQLHERSGRLARFLSERGVGPGAYVGLCVERSPQLMVALLGILKARAAYVPLDPEYPVGRLRYVLADTAARLLLTQEHLRPLFPDHDGAVVCLDRWQERSDGRPAEPATAAASDIAYVIHTSGSTGKPKGVLVPHRSLANHSSAVNRHFGFGPGDRVLQCRPLSFDAAAEEIFPPLLHGATLVLCDHPLRQTFRALTQQVIDTRTTFLSIPTAFWHSWVAEEDCLTRLASESSLRMVIVAGEKAQRAALHTWKKHIGEGIRWCNVYGPTEGTITSTLYEPGADWEQEESSSVPIGFPVENVRTYILDDGMEPAPAGAAGELYIGGEGVATGYLNAPAVTAERFLADSFSGVPGRRLYRTGDLARAGADGCIEFVGRRDHQVKLRGYRIELGEIELVLGEHPDVRACVALAGESDQENPTLVCYVVAHDSVTLSTGELMAFLRRELPWYMIPASLLVVDEFPMTPNGKIDRNALLTLAPSGNAEGDYIAPRTAAEATMASIWEDVLEKRNISVDADFFQSGGHSLLAAGLLSRIRSRLRVRVPTRVLFESPTIEGLAAAVTRMTSESATDQRGRE